MTMLDEVAQQYLERASEDESIEQALARAASFRAAAVAAGADLPAELVVRGTAATEAEVRAVEDRLDAKLPDEYRAFLLAFGSLAFAGDSVKRTYAVGELVAQTEALAGELDEEGYTDEDFVVFDPLDDVLALEGADREPWEVELVPPIVPIAAMDTSNAVVTVPALASDERPVPIFVWYHDDASVLEGFAPTLRAWVSHVVDEMIASTGSAD